MNNTATDAGFLDRLRSSTSQSHKNLESLPVSLSIVNPSVTKQEYIHYLSLMHDVVKDAEKNIFPLLNNIITDIQERSKFSLIENDLKVLGHIKTVYYKALSNKTEIHSHAFALGILYVIEGSVLGGRFILKNISEALGFNPENGAQYFAGYGNATGSKWKSFLNMMIVYEEQHECEEDIIAGANFAFDEINKYFTENTPL